MDVSVGLPLNMPGANGESAIAWARRAQELNFPGIGASDRLVYPNMEPVVSLGAAAAVTTSLRMTLSVLITPLRTNAVHMAKELATLDQLSGGRLCVGVGIGGIKWDFEGSGLEDLKRGAMIERQIEEMRAVWAGAEHGTGGAVGPAPVQAGGPRLLYGGYADAAIKRGARMTDGYLGGGATADFSYCAGVFDKYWQEFGRNGKPWKAAHRYFALGPDGPELGRKYVENYYNPGWAGHYTEWMIERLLTTPAAIRQAAREFGDAGCDDMILFPTTTDIAQLDLLADAVHS